MMVGEFIINCIVIITIVLIIYFFLLMFIDLWTTRKEPATQIWVFIAAVITLLLYLNFKYPEFSVNNFLHYKLW